MTVWSYDAADLDHTKLDDRPIYETPDIRRFLAFEKSEKRIISGLKGAGKTLFLKLISNNCRKRGGFTLIPTTELTERLYSIDHEFSGDKIKSWVSSERWKHVWRTVLSVVVLKAVSYRLPNSVLDLFPDSLGISVGAHLSAAIKSRAGSSPGFQEIFPNHLDKGIQSITHAVALFVDNIDEAFSRHAGYDLYQDSIERHSQTGAHSYDLWLSAQIGFLLATRELTDRNSHLKLFGTVRTEAVRDNPLPIAFNLRSNILDLQYNPSELRGIFAKKLEFLREKNPALFCRAHESDHIMAFFQSNCIKHHTVKTLEGEPFSEDIFEYLRRHTRGRPRELDFLGSALQNISCAYRTESAIRETVQVQSTAFFGFARNETVPYWKPELDELLQNIPCNFITREKAIKIACKHFRSEDAYAIWDALRANGICGAVVKENPNGLVQKFSQHDNFKDLSKADFEAAKIWVIHPCVNIATRPRRKCYEAYKWSVAGHAYGFTEQPKLRQKHIHVLIGAGRLGLGLVVPVVLKDSETKVLVIARSSEKWMPLVEKATSERQTLEIHHSSLALGLGAWKESICIRVVADNNPEWESDLRRSIQKSTCVILVASQPDSFRKALSLSDSIGVSVGGDNLETVAETISKTVPIKARAVLAYENDEGKVEAVQKMLAPRGLSVIPTVVDRICSDLKISEKGIVVHAEEYGMINAFSGLVPNQIPRCFSNDTVQEAATVDNEIKFAFVRERKKRLVNTLHFCAAAIALAKLIEVEATIDVANAKILGMISGNMDIQSQLTGLKDVMILTVLGTIHLEDMERPLLEKTIQDLHEYGNVALRRMRDSHDAPNRVLRSDIDTLRNKYKRLFADVSELSRRALLNKYVYELFQMNQKEVEARLNALKSLILNLFVFPQRDHGSTP
jgi:hypothetical protein